MKVQVVMEVVIDDYCLKNMYLCKVGIPAIELAIENDWRSGYREAIKVQRTSGSGQWPGRETVGKTN